MRDKQLLCCLVLVAASCGGGGETGKDAGIDQGYPDAPSTAPVLSSFIPSPSQVQGGVPTAITWTWTYATEPVIPTPTCSIDNGVGTVTLTGNNTYAGGTVINAGTLQVGNGGTTGSIGTGSVTDNGTLIFNRSDNVTLTNLISGGGSLVKQGSGTLTLAATNTYFGTTTVSNGALVINGGNSAIATFVFGGTLGGTGTLSGPVTLEAGTTLAPGASVGTLTINSDLSIGGNLAIEVDKSLSPSNDLVVVSGVLTNTGTGTLTVANLGPALAPGDKFALFSQPVQNGAALTVTGSGASWTNNLAVDGSISVIPHRA